MHWRGHRFVSNTHSHLSLCCCDLLNYILIKKSNFVKTVFLYLQPRFVFLFNNHVLVDMLNNNLCAV